MTKVLSLRRANAVENSNMGFLCALKDGIIVEYRPGTRNPYDLG